MGQSSFPRYFFYVKAFGKNEIPFIALMGYILMRIKKIQIHMQASKYNRLSTNDFRILMSCHIPHFVSFRYRSHLRAQWHMQILNVTGRTSPST